MPENDAADLGSIKWWQVALTLQNFAQHRIRRLLSTRATDYFGSDLLDGNSHVRSMATTNRFGERSTTKRQAELLNLRLR